MILSRLQSLSYRTRLLGALLVVNIPMFVLLSINEIVTIRDLSFQREYESINTLGQFLANEMTTVLIEGDTAEMNGIFNVAVRQAQIKAISVLDITNTVISSSTPALVGKTISPPADLPISKLKNNFLRKSFIIHGRRLHGCMPRFLQIDFSLAKALGNLATTLAWEVAIDVIEIIIILLVAWLISGLLQKPLVEMRDVSDKMATGDFSHRLRVRSDDVIGRLAAGFNNMSERLFKLTNNMQEEIRRATHELTSRNRELKEKHEELEASNKKLKELDALKSDFVSMVSHELRTPLTSIIGFAKTLKTLPLPKDQQMKYLDIIESEGKRLSGLVEEYLDISKIESGNFSLRPEPMRLADCIRPVVDSFVIHSHHPIRIDMPASLPDLFADATLITRVLQNIIDNAIKYSGGSQEIVVSARVADDAIIVSVRDFGEGIHPDDLEKVFDKFYRGKDSIAKKRRGSGLGLAISKGIIEAHNGKIWITSEPGKGTTVSFLLPLLAKGA